ncbi:MAG: HNH endonuclease [Candidatus Shapirobacteria bacterium]|nr:HNH endonuclease [Candidatus Shapirobacteria bacterium]
MRTKNGKYSTPYTRSLIKKYLRSIYKATGKSPTFRDVNSIPGPSSRTIIRHFGTWTKALKASGIRPHTNQLMEDEKLFIRQNWKEMTDKDIAEKLGLTSEIIKYYRIQYDLWKNRKGTSDQKHKKDGMKAYGKNCEICNISITELHHIVPKSTNINDWAILCPTCHSVITRKLVVVKNRDDLKTKLTPYIKSIYKNIRFNLVANPDSDNVST